MSKPEESLYTARVTENDERRMYADENSVCDNQMRQLFEDRNKAQADVKKQEQADAQRLVDEAIAQEHAAKQAEKQAKKQKRCRNRMITDVTGFQTRERVMRNLGERFQGTVISKAALADWMCG